MIIVINFIQAIIVYKEWHGEVQTNFYKGKLLFYGVIKAEGYILLDLQLHDLTMNEKIVKVQLHHSYVCIALSLLAISSRLHSYDYTATYVPCMHIFIAT